MFHNFFPLTFQQFKKYNFGYILYCKCAWSIASTSSCRFPYSMPFSCQERLRFYFLEWIKSLNEISFLGWCCDYKRIGFMTSCSSLLITMTFHSQSNINTRPLIYQKLKNPEVFIFKRRTKFNLNFLLLFFLPILV